MRRGKRCARRTVRTFELSHTTHKEKKQCFNICIICLTKQRSDSIKYINYFQTNYFNNFKIWVFPENHSNPFRKKWIDYCSRSKFLSKLLKTFDKTFREIFPVFISTKRREKPSAFFDNNFVNNAYFSEAASSSSSHLASSSSKAPISSRMTCLCLWSS